MSADFISTITLISILFNAVDCSPLHQAVPEIRGHKILSNLARIPCICDYVYVFCMYAYIHLCGELILYTTNSGHSEFKKV